MNGVSRSDLLNFGRLIEKVKKDKVDRNFTKIEMVEAVYMKFGFSRRDSVMIVDMFFDEIIRQTREDKIVKITNFGVFRTVKTARRVGRNPKTMQEYLILESKKLKFYLSKNFSHNGKV